jgi:hypothetical protein
METDGDETHDGSEFTRFSHIPRRGFTSIEARQYLESQFTSITTWTVWLPKHNDSFKRIVQTADQQNGVIGSWRWERVKNPYPFNFYFNMENGRGGYETNWTGLLKFTGPDNITFLIFSFFGSSGFVGGLYLVSTPDLVLLERFEKAVNDCLCEENTHGMIRIDVSNGRDIYLTPESDERIVLPATMITDIERQVISFFQNPQAFAKFNISYRRGLLFVGTPGGGKTMMIRHLIRLCHTSFKAEILSINIKRTTNEDEITAFFERASRMAPCMVILEDLDSLTKESAVSRSALLNQLDGLKPRKGLLVIGTTNNPEDIDPALIHRPSRFDRIWIFEMPDKKLRREYLEHSLPGADPGLVTDISEKTADWSFAYLNELRTTASILAIQDGSESVNEKHIEQAFVLMTAQFKSNKNGHKGKGKQAGLGFEAA